MLNLVYLAQTVLAFIITGSVLLQAQGSGFGTTWSGGGETYHTRRGLEKVVFYLTIVCVGLFIATSLGLLILE
jgi:protein translocase SecG subunit